MPDYYGQFEELQVSPYFELVFHSDVRFQITQLVVKRPHIPKLEESPTITMRLKGNRVIIHTGVSDHVVDLMKLPSEMRAFFSGVSVVGKAGLQPTPMPNKSQIQRSDGRFMGYWDYDSTRMSKLIKQKNKVDEEKGNQYMRIPDHWTQLPKCVYETLVKFYKIQDLLKDGPLFL